MKRLSLLFVSMLGLVLMAAGPVLAQNMPDGFREEDVAERLSLPTAFAFLPDGRVLIAEKAGVVRVYKNGQVLPTPFIDISGRVNDYWDRGLLGIAVDKNFASNGYVYLAYTYENDRTDYEGPKTARLVRVTATGDTADPGTETVLLGTTVGRSCNNFPDNTDCIASDSTTHSVGNVKVASDGTLFFNTGDGADAGAVNDDAMRSQNLDLLNGKVLHITPDGKGLPTNPFFTGNVNDNRSKVWASGLRNAFRFNLRPGTDVPYLGDVGWGGWEEADVVPKGANLGWPCYEGNHIQTGYQSKPACQELISGGASAHQEPLVEWPHDNPGGSASLGGAFYTGTSYPEEYRDAYFYGDYAQGWIRYLRVNANDELVGGPTGFMTGVDGPVDIEMGPDGSLYYLSVTAGELRRIKYIGQTGGVTCPDGKFLAKYYSNKDLGGAPNIERCEDEIDNDWGDGGPGGGVGTDGFSARWVGTFDFEAGDHTFTARADDGVRVFVDGEPVIDAWRDQGPDTHEATRTMSAGPHEVKVEYYENGGGAVAQVGWREAVPNEAPVPIIETPSSDLTWKVGDTINYSGSATDAEDGAIPSTGLSWQVVLHHCQGGSCHTHFLGDSIGAFGTFRAPSHGDDNYYFEIILKATDSRGKTGKTSVNVQPQTARVTVDTQPSGLQVVYGSQAGAGPITRTVVVGSSFTIGAPSPQGDLEFESWSDGGARQHDITVPASDTVYTATFDSPGGGGTSCPNGEFLAKYYSNKVLGGDPVVERCEDKIDNDWGDGGPGGGVGVDNFSVRWVGTFDFEAGDHTFTARADDGVRVFVDGEPVIDAWRDQGPDRHQATRAMSAGPHEVKVEYYENGGGAVAQVGWKKTTVAGDVTCPTGQFLAEYYDNTTLGGAPSIKRCEDEIDNDWGGGGPGGGVGPDGFSARWVGTFDFEAGDHNFFAEADDGVRVFVDGASVIDAWRDQGPDRHEATRTMTAGLHEVKVEYYENGGGAVVRVGWEKRVDATAPDTSILTKPPDITNDRSGTFEFSSSEPDSTFECKLDDSAYAACVSPKAYPGLSDGPHTFSVRATDAAGNVDESPATHAWSIDTDAPRVTDKIPGAGATDVAKGASVSATFSEDVAASTIDGSTFKLTKQGSSTGVAATVTYDAATKAATLDPSADLDEGATYTAVITTGVRDKAGNPLASSETWSFTTRAPADTTPPDTTITSGPTGTVKTTSATFGFNSNEAGSRFECKLDAGAYQACVSPKQYTALSDGQHTFQVRAIDAAGNTDGSPAARTWTIDATPPVASAPRRSFVADSALGSSTIPVRLSWSATDGATGVASYQLQRSTNGGAFSNVGLADASATSTNVSLNPNTTYAFRVRAQDRAGNWSQWAVGPSFVNRVVQQDSSAIGYVGTWNNQSVSSAYGGSLRYASGAGTETATYNFTGDEVAWIATKATNRGIAEVYVDGAKVATVDLYASSTQARKVVFSRSLSPGNHTLQIRVLGTKNASSSGARVDVDAFIVMP